MIPLLWPQVSPAVRVEVHENNKGYGGQSEHLLQTALDAGADIVIMVHPDYQYTPKLIPAMAAMIGNGLYHCVIGSRILGGYALRGGMPLWKYLANRFLTLSENLLVGAKLSEYHSGYRAFSRQLLNDLTWSKTQTISCSITRCLFRLYGTAMRSQRLLVLPITTRKLHLSRKDGFRQSSAVPQQPCRFP
jgi:glycosyltransferase involved in cell wall biosynthesis